MQLIRQDQMCFHNLQPEDMLNLFLNFSESQSTYGYKRYGYKKGCMVIFIYIGSDVTSF